ncbi:hypothetical protein I6A84_03465 [Frankia sp. CNm7]|uniref:Integral membrane protein n=1 Tax=Frankia nepalensis TaxID=1836974 RepID=A0A937UPK1_9ACTN|nr:hypothetical protein [Frankia nepalensis]MBL7498586.1 hypothetical protein [Frankia nepalensis]MBL7510455.1 hypothetical protein [Frankia nepalensis]MBL7517205.1 hypothetical protein [Frankia nepalensis]MBL7625651.1 hypothetical protein [Frankia nepalensis]
MPHSGPYGLVLTLHVLGALFVISPLTFAGLCLPALAFVGHRALPILRPAPWLLRIAAVASLGVVALGLFLVPRGPFGEIRGYGDGWITSSMALWAIATLLTVTILAGGVSTAVAEIEQTGMAARRRLPWLALTGLITTACWISIVYLMVVKPGM